MPLQPGGTYYGFFVSTNNSGVLQAADSLPTAVVKRNGATDSAVAVTITAGTIAGEYVVSFLIPNTYVDGDQVSFRASWLVNGYQKVAYGAMVVLAAPATGSGNAALTVTVTNSVTSGTVSGAEVTLINSAGGVAANGTTNSSGVTVPALGAPAGVYTLVTTDDGYGSATQSITLASGANTQAVSLVPNTLPTPVAGYCALTGFTIVDGVATAGIPWNVTITALPGGFAAGNDIIAIIKGTSIAGGAIGTGSPPAVYVPQGCTYTHQAGNGVASAPQTAPSSSNGSLPSVLA